MGSAFLELCTPLRYTSSIFNLTNVILINYLMSLYLDAETVVGKSYANRE